MTPPKLLAQSDKYTEVTAVDTINLKPIEFSHEIRSGSKPFPFVKKDEDNMQNTISLYEIGKILSRNKFAFQIMDKSSYAITPASKPDSVMALKLGYYFIFRFPQ